MNVDISDKIYLSGLTEQESDAVKAALTYSNPKYEEAVKFGRSTWNIPYRLGLYEETAAGLAIPRGCDLPGWVERTVIDQRHSHKVTIETTIELRDYQVRVVDLTLEQDQGLLVAATGAGKTTMGVELAARRGERCLILVKSKDLAKQWQAAIKQLTGLDCGLIGGGKWQEGAEFTVATIQTLSKHSGSLDYGMVIVDECHNIPAAQAYKAINQQAAKYRYGLSATPNRRDGLEFMIHAALGKVIVKVDEWELGASVLPVMVNKVDYPLSGFADSWGEYMALLELDPGRNALVINQAIQSSLVIGTVVLTATVSHAETLARLADDRGVDALVLHGQLPAKVRAERMAAAPGAPLIIGTLSLLSEGIDWPHLGAVVFAAPVSAAVDKAVPSATRLIQSIGRARRPYPGKVRAMVFDVVDQTGFGRAAFNKRMEIYAQQGFGVNTGAVDHDGDFFEVDEEDFDYEY